MSWLVVEGQESRAVEHRAGQMAARTMPYPNGDVELQIVRTRPSGSVKILGAIRLPPARWLQLIGQAP